MGPFFHYCEVYFLGDMNTDILIHDGYLHRKVQHLCVEQTLVQLINEPTRVTATSTTGIDLILVSNREKVIQHGVIKTTYRPLYALFSEENIYTEKRTKNHLHTEFQKL